MVRISARRVTIYTAVGLYCFILLHVRNSTKYLEDKPPDFSEHDHTYLFFDPRTPAPKSTTGIEEKAKPAGRTGRYKELRKEKNDTRETVTPIRFHRAQSHQKNVTPVTSKMTTITTSAKRFTTTVRPSSCDGCFQTDFPVLTDQPGVCRVAEGSAAIDIVFLIASARRNFARRRAVRHTWASVTRNNTGNLRHVFVLGTVGEDSKLTRAVEDEARRFGDVIVVGFRDSYRNLTLKVISSLRWLSRRCQQARFFMKVDDDVWVNTPVVTSQLTGHADFLQRGVAGHCSHTWQPRRDRTSKWYVPPHLYPGDTYPPYCQGMAYAGGLVTAQRIVSESVHVPFFAIEDVYVGMCLQRLGLGTRNLGNFSNYYSHHPCQGRSSRVPTIHSVSAGTMFELWGAQCSSSSGEEDAMGAG